jgi:hypothetical protein
VTARAVQLKVKPRTLRVEVSPLMRAITVATLGKLALQHETTAHELLPAFGLLLDCDTDSVLRNNVLCALADLCGRSDMSFSYVQNYKIGVIHLYTI